MRTRLGFPVALLLLLLGAAVCFASLAPGVALADEGDPATGGTAGWSPPEGVPVRDLPEGERPPPRVRREGDAALPGSMTDGPAATDPFADDADAPVSEGPVMRPRPTQTTVVEIDKEHNVVWRSQGYALKLDIDFQVVGQAGRFLGARVDFYDKKSGRPIRSILYPFANRAGQASVWTIFTKICWNDGSLRSTLHMPYRAFPCPGGDQGSYEIEARVRLLRWECPGKVSDLATSSTAFTVHNSVAEGQTAPKRPTLADAGRPNRVPHAPDQAGNWVWCLPRNNCLVQQAANLATGNVSDAGCRPEGRDRGL